MRSSLLVAFALALVAGAASLRSAEPRWYRGCTHVHTLWSDADGAPELVTDWYRQHGYQFLVLSDHNVMQTGETWFAIDAADDPRLTSAHVAELRARFGDDAVSVREREGQQEMRLWTLDQLRARFEKPQEFLLIPGEEISDGPPTRPVHVNGLNLAESIPPQGGASAREMAERDLAAIVAQGERLQRPVLGHLNHPNFRWALTPDDVAELRSERFFEVYNGHPGTNGHGDATHPGNEELWDRANARRVYELDLPLLYALATDDAHDHHVDGPTKSNRGRGWIQVRAGELSAGALIEAMRAGEFYASSGVELADVHFDGKTLTVDIAQEPGVSYQTRFIGCELLDGAVQSGVLFLETDADPARYPLSGREGYVRATVTSSRAQPNPAAVGDAERAWTQPVRGE
ncbi:MAG: hypothetical protein EXS08_02730 [Planctomycetes bacterium]|nr:hypothetical protein [Planctomycetota bacterium]